MNTRTSIACTCFLVLVCLTAEANAGPFQNLDFEDSAYTASSGSLLTASASALFPSWTLRFGDAIQTTGSLNIYQLAGPVAALFTANAAGGNVLEGSHTPFLAAWVGLSGVSFGQVGDVPVGTKSIRFKARNNIYNVDPVPPGPFDISLNGQSVPVVVLSQSAGDMVVGADVSAWAGMTAELRLTVLTNGIPAHLGQANIDAIAFSPVPIPEPATIAIIATTIALLRRRRPQ